MMRIVFLGTPEFAAGVLEALIEAKKTIVGVVTAPDKKSGRGQKITESPVKQLAKQHGLSVLQPTNLKSPDFVAALRALKPDLQIVVAFRMLPKVVWQHPPMGTVNLHASLLPQYRGAAPIHWAVVNGEKQTGVTTFFLKHEIDTGNILEQKTVEIGDDDTTGVLYEKLCQVGAGTLVETVNKIEHKTYVEKPQTFSKDLKIAPKIFKKDCEIDFTKDAIAVKNFVRGMTPWPGAWTTVLGFKTKIFVVAVNTTREKECEIGEYLSDGQTFLSIMCQDAFVDIVDLQKEGKKRLPIIEFLKGVQL